MERSVVLRPFPAGLGGGRPDPEAAQAPVVLRPFRRDRVVAIAPKSAGSLASVIGRASVANPASAIGRASVDSPVSAIARASTTGRGWAIARASTIALASTTGRGWAIARASTIALASTTGRGWAIARTSAIARASTTGLVSAIALASTTGLASAIALASITGLASAIALALTTALASTIGLASTIALASITGREAAPTSIDLLTRVDGVRPPAYNGWRGAYWGYHQGWANGYWHGYHENNNWGWGSFALGAATGVSAWALGSSFYNWGYANYANPYYAAGAVAQPIVIEQTVVGGEPQTVTVPAYNYDYSQPIDTQSAPPPEEVANPAVAKFDLARAAFRHRRLRRRSPAHR